MVAYDIDTAAAMDAVRKTEAELAVLASVPAEFQRSVDTVATALGSSRVARAFTTLGAGEILPNLQSVLSRAEDAVQGANQAVAEYLRADEEMRARAEAAAAAVPDASGHRAESALPPAALPIVPSAPPAPLPLPKSGGQDSGSARALPAPRPKPLPQKPEPEPDPDSGTVTPLPGPPPWRPAWLFRPALPGRPPIVVARDLMLRLYYPCPGSWPPHPGCLGPWWRGPAYPPGGWYPRWPARPLPALFPNPRITPPPGHVHAWPLEAKRLPLPVALGGPEAVSGENSSGKWGLT
ncbi:DUF6507 family protein [Arthrobacter sp. zg-Y820]|uniref:DUF6507 family protein n=1 Tax=unclassified Arthrobacter TaxID=235627 RepID=UPI001E3C38DF|nr:MULTISPECIES: DUF6507 family protein [unclassified Arthrobacter]MCC9198435.1 DUF6507 family protein [Arthrobacter sp. zg-Y820]MDK1281305.1 DUF6507 family protein [Arthrobacter sp. zg.Y820]WIB09939.1 DUF6507 family protein [Arthrobacter sp. zg-Y820]